MAKIVQGLETFKPRTAASTDSLFHQLVQFKSALEAAAGVGAEAGAEKMTEPPVRRRM